MILHDTPPEFVEKAYRNPRVYDIPRIRLFYNESERVLIAKKPGDTTLGVLVSRFTEVILYLRMQRGVDVLRDEMSSTGRTTWDIHVDGE